MIAVVLGGAECWRDDLVALEEMAGIRLVDWPGPVLATNDTGAVIERLDHWCTLHAEKMAAWKAQRARDRRPSTYRTWSCTNRKPAIEHHFDGWKHGSSGLYAGSVALLALNADAVVYCGCPIDRRPNAFRDDAEWIASGRYQKGWARPEVVTVQRERARSMSGWTRWLLGPPTPEWIAHGMREDAA